MRSFAWRSPWPHTRLHVPFKQQQSETVAAGWRYLKGAALFD
jgi:hypothetical protein